MNEHGDPIVELSRERIENGSKSFAAAAKLLPEDIRSSTYMLYAWCRHCDDMIDGQELGFANRIGNDAHAVPHHAKDIVEGLRRQTLAAARGEPEGPVFEGLARVMAKHGLSERHPLELIEGFAMDANGRACKTLTDTVVYSYYVAGVVGLMMARVMGVQDLTTLQRAADLGIAFQLTNIARDVMEDASQGRIYLPLSWLSEAGVPVEQIGNPAHREGVADVTARLLIEADRYYASALCGIAELPARAAISIAAARSIYRTIGVEVKARGERAWDRRIVVSKRKKVAAVLLAPLQVAEAKAGRLWRNPSRDGLWTHPQLVA